jgi:hypothetical protein
MLEIKVGDLIKKINEHVESYLLENSYDEDIEVMFEEFLKEDLVENLLTESKYSHIDFKPTESMAKAAERGLELRKKAKKSNKGGLSNKQASKLGIGSGVQRAVNIKNRNKLSPSTIKRMYSFFKRHEKNAKIDAGKSAHEDRGYISWLLWGGNPGFSWVRKIIRQMEAADKK